MNNKKEKGSISIHHFHEGEISHLTDSLRQYVTYIVKVKAQPQITQWGVFAIAALV